MSSTVSEARIKRAFATFDYNNKGHITHDELERILRALGFRGMSKQLVATFMRTTSTRKNPSEVTFGDCLRIVQSSGFDHIFEESFQVCQVLDKEETGRIVPAAMAKAAKQDGRFDAYINPADVAEFHNGHGFSTSVAGSAVRRSSLTGSPSPSYLPAAGRAKEKEKNGSISGLATGTGKPAVTTDGDEVIDENELVGGGDRSREDVKPLALPLVDADSVLTTSRTPLAPASVKRQKLFSQIHKFVNRAEDSHSTSAQLYTTHRHTTQGANAYYNTLNNAGTRIGGGAGGASGGLAGLLSPTAVGFSPLGASGNARQSSAQLQLAQDAQDVIDTALTFDEWRHVQTTAEKVSEAEARKRRRNLLQGGAANTSLSGTLRGLSASGMNTPRGANNSTVGGGISLSCSRYDR